MKPIVGIIGLGIMGSAMANALMGAGYRVIGYDVRAKPRQWLKRAGGRPMPSCGAVATQCRSIDHVASISCRT